MLSSLWKWLFFLSSIFSSFQPKCLNNPIHFWPFPRGCLDIYSVLISFNSSPVYLFVFPFMNHELFKDKRMSTSTVLWDTFPQISFINLHFRTQTLNFALLCTRSYAWSHRQKQRGISHGILRSFWRKLRYICKKARKYCAKETEGRDWF